MKETFMAAEKLNGVNEATVEGGGPAHSRGSHASLVGKLRQEPGSDEATSSRGGGLILMRRRPTRPNPILMMMMMMMVQLQMQLLRLRMRFEIIRHSW